MKRAVISGRAGVALLMQEDGRLSSLHVSDSEWVTRRPEEVRLLFGEMKDLLFVEGVEHEDVQKQLARARANDQALHLALILLDPELSDRLRQQTATTLEQALIKGDDARQYLESILYAHPLPEEADLTGAKKHAESVRATRTLDLLTEVGKLQPHIAAVRQAWEAIPEKVFGSDETRQELDASRQEFQATAVRIGLFRDHVQTIAQGKVPDTLRPIPQFPELPAYYKILNEWRVRLHSSHHYHLRAPVTASRSAKTAQRQISALNAVAVAAVGRRLQDAPTRSGLASAFPPI